LVRPYGYKGLAFATSFSYCVNFLVLYILLWQRLGRLWDRPFASSLIRMSMATALMSALAYVAYVRLFAYFPADTVAARLVLASVPITIAVIAYAAFSRFFGVEELDGFLRVLKRTQSKG
jgi:peptidoglycan biosynthesis protein MviN/MurJ (putative lipid II flippase)